MRTQLLWLLVLFGLVVVGYGVAAMIPRRRRDDAVSVTAVARVVAGLAMVGLGGCLVLAGAALIAGVD